MSSPRVSGEKKGTHSPKGYGGEEGQPGIAADRRPVGPLLSHRFAAGPFPLPSVEGRGQSGRCSVGQPSQLCLDQSNTQQVMNVNEAHGPIVFVDNEKAGNLQRVQLFQCFGRESVRRD